jgi:hypothetical protein
MHKMQAAQVAISQILIFSLAPLAKTRMNSGTSAVIALIIPMLRWVTLAIQPMETGIRLNTTIGALR